MMKNKCESTYFLYHQKSLVGVKGRLQPSSYEDKDGTKKYTSDIIAEKVTFLSSKRVDV